VENRLRFLREVIAAIRAAVGADYPVGVRRRELMLGAGGLRIACGRRLCNLGHHSTRVHVVPSYSWIWIPVSSRSNERSLKLTPSSRVGISYSCE
jgi:2,4-dienoyl-CoA reductase-like NADH-dependent reductase (Old Yellow Enzyme family)